MPFNTRSHHTGRLPTLRDSIVEFMRGKKGNSVTALEIAAALDLHKSAPYRVLKELMQMKLVERNMGLDGAEFTLDDQYYEYLKETQPRRIN